MNRIPSQMSRGCAAVAVALLACAPAWAGEDGWLDLGAKRKKPPVSFLVGTWRSGNDKVTFEITDRGAVRWNDRHDGKCDSYHITVQMGESDVRYYKIGFVYDGDRLVPDRLTLTDKLKPDLKREKVSWVFTRVKGKD